MAKEKTREVSICRDDVFPFLVLIFDYEANPTLGDNGEWDAEHEAINGVDTYDVLTFLEEYGITNLPKPGKKINCRLEM